MSRKPAEKKGGAKPSTKKRAATAKSAPPPRKAPLAWRLFKLGLKLGLVLALLGGATLVGGYWYYAQGLPDLRKLDDYRPPQVSRVLAADGTVIAELYDERRTVVDRAQIPDLLVHAVLSAEDADFYRHEGLDYTGMLRALYNSLRAGRLTGSGSTITQQTVKNLLLSQERSFDRKAKELILARRLDAHLSKDDILTIYLNAIYLGHGRYGMHEAARYYFGHEKLADLTLPEAATLAGLIQSPERISPRKHPDKARDRRAFVLRMMVKNGYITEAEEKAAEASPMAVAEPPRAYVADAGWFADAVRAELVAQLGEEAVRTGGLRVHTTLDMARQRAAVDALRGGLRALDARQKFGAPLARVPAAKAEAWRARRKKALKDAPPAPGEPVQGRVTAVDDGALIVELGVGEARVSASAVARFAGEDGAAPYAVGDVLTVAVRADGPHHPDRMKATLVGAPQGAVVVLDPQTRDVLALVGGDDYRQGPFDRTHAARQPGSAFKSFVWGAAIDSRRYTAASTMIDAPETLRVHQGKFWQPKNYTRKFRGPISLRNALAQSINSVAVALTDDLGVPAVHAFARAAGIESPLADGPAVALGASEVKPIELANAYATLAAGGRFGEPRLITRVEGPQGPIALPELPLEPRIDPAVAFVMRSLLRTVVTDGTAKSLSDLPRPLAGKTGTSNEARDAWFVGLLPEVVIAVWVGFDTPKSLGRKESGGHTAAPVAKAYLAAVEKTGPDWPPPPDGVELRRIADERHLAADDEGREEVFLTGTAPTEMAPAAGEVDARRFMFEEVGALDGPAVAVPSIDVAPLPPTLRPIAPAPAEPAEDPLGDAPRGLDPIAPAPSPADDEDLPP
ncbi:MAG: PBP1A family penicillin-binding protein [Myxococcales bacterium]|nr:PBP1A family penicillin-binding protein [Myxococcales bacterium]